MHVCVNVSDPLELSLTDSCELPGRLGIELRPSEREREHPMLLTPEPSPQPPNLISFCPLLLISSYMGREGGKFIVMKRSFPGQARVLLGGLATPPVEQKSASDSPP